MPYKVRAVQLEAQRQHYRRNKEAYIARSKQARVKRKRAIRDVIDTFKANTACVDCGQSFPAICMDFDHNGAEKCFGIADAITKNVSLSTLMAEMKKCELVCANCHRVRTFDKSIQVGLTE